MRNAYPKAVAVFTPTHASWLNQIELYFDIVEQKALKPKDVASLPALAGRILGFEKRYNGKAEPFSRNFDREDLRELLRELS